jgi:hypothetical protein
VSGGTPATGGATRAGAKCAGPGGVAPFGAAFMRILSSKARLAPAPVAARRLLAVRANGLALPCDAPSDG